MGFDFFIKMRISFCETTGKPFLYQFKDGKLMQNFDINSIVVPEEHRRFLSQRGHFLSLYIEDLEVGNDHFEADIYQVLEAFPSWEDIECSELSKRYDLTEKEHNAFREALEWFENQSCGFYASWSY